MTPKEFQDSGLLLEVNRRVLHPLGVALAVTVCRDHKVWDDGTVDDHTPEECPLPDGKFGPILTTDDIEGFEFEFDAHDIERMRKLYTEAYDSPRSRARIAKFGTVVQSPTKAWKP